MKVAVRLRGWLDSRAVLLTRSLGDVGDQFPLAGPGSRALGAVVSRDQRRAAKLQRRWRWTSPRRQHQSREAHPTQTVSPRRQTVVFVSGLRSEHSNPSLPRSTLAGSGLNRLSVAPESQCRAGACAPSRHLRVSAVDRARPPSSRGSQRRASAPRDGWRTLGHGAGIGRTPYRLRQPATRS